jgi:hypothetical protein
LSFTTCKQCGKEWSGRDAFLADAGVALSGCQVETDHPAASALLFDHRAAGCGTTLALPLRRFDDLYTGPRHKVKWATSKLCPGMCFDPHNTEPCDKECACAYVRAILQEVRKLSGRDGEGA